MNLAAMRAQHRAAALYVEGDAPNELQRVDSAGVAIVGEDPIPFNPDHRTVEGEYTDAGLLLEQVMLITVRQALVVGASYSWSGSVWTVSEVGDHALGSESGVWHYSLAAQKRSRS